MGWFWSKNEFQSQPNATGPTVVQSKPTGTPLSEKLNSGDWGKGWPFYKGTNNWTDYLSSGALVQSITGKRNLNNKGNIRGWLLFKEPPTGTLLVDSDSKAMINAQLPYAPYVSGGMKPKTNTLPAGYYKKGSTFKVVQVDMYTQTVTQTTFKLYSAREIINSLGGEYKFINQLRDDLQKYSSKVNQAPVSIKTDLDKRIGQWKKVLVETAPLKKVSQQSAIDAVRNQMSPFRPIIGGNQVPFKPSKTKEDTFFTTQKIALIGVGVLAVYVYYTREK